MIGIQVNSYKNYYYISWNNGAYYANSHRIVLSCLAKMLSIALYISTHTKDNVFWNNTKF